LGAIEQLTEAVQKLNKKVDNLPVQGWAPQPAEKGKFVDREGLSEEEIAEFLDVGVSTIKKYREQIPHVWIGKRIIYPKTAILKWLEDKSMKNIESDRREVEGAIIRKLIS